MSAVSIAEARNTLTRLIHKAEDGEPVHITRRGKPVAVLVSRDEYERLQSGEPRAACETPGVCGLAQSSILLVNTHLPWIADWMPALEDRRHAERWK